ncbi:uncharacterized protein H6S33_004561 [Morchella sextelata]|uniref:uncharacterized protein n=1 Tax=Morchella sextelata TaxID=1174677 RepID=UPI001D04C9E4|nr:uncharacterized protein H6S33_004561 [Morchella sextelata]KAH0605339.1 hypothetical protein H6S33_004561 [Morchella sextelata]
MLNAPQEMSSDLQQICCSPFYSARCIDDYKESGELHRWDGAGELAADRSGETFCLIVLKPLRLTGMLHVRFRVVEYGAWRTTSFRYWSLKDASAVVVLLSARTQINRSKSTDI